MHIAKDIQWRVPGPKAGECRANIAHGILVPFEIAQCDQWGRVWHINISGQKARVDADMMLIVASLRWQVAIIGMLWDQWWAIWVSRNKDLHGADNLSRAQAETREVHRKLRELYDLRSRLSNEVQVLANVRRCNGALL